jgi:prepilin-type N-terminal cleavage/methylation domain-containing protein
MITLPVPQVPTFRQRGFTLTEMAVVLVIVALLIGGMMVPMSAQQEARLNAETQTSLKTVQDSLLGFVVANGRLPCPANPTLATGVEDCTRQWGALPWGLLGITPTDAWGRLYTYRVTDSFKDALPGGNATLTPPVSCTATPTQSSFALCSDGDITITDGAATPNTVAGKVPAIIVSHGANGRGAYLPGGNATPLSAGTGNELENSNSDATFVNKVPDPNFDDIVVWLPTSILANRMISAGKLP